METELHYSLSITWSDADQAFVVRVPEFPDAMTHGATYAEAAARGEELIQTVAEHYRAIGRPLPPPGTTP